ncbi:uncharacterized protein LOC117180512 [Belonocnema kinseyi]|uniref:uncharacterized protein LOC117180512 n=1 Tax=Belonocnema kinseyi TaxID=2817044 RepID=UPI00143CDE04|nr:uncharacterized protein LOC117180512 [Belonocnema kinseyi]
MKEVLHYDPTLIFRSVKEILKNYAQGPALIQDIEKGSFSELKKRTFIRILVAELIKFYDNNYSPPDEAKCSLAMAIIHDFPNLKSDLGEYGCVRFSFYYIRSKL